MKTSFTLLFLLLILSFFASVDCRHISPSPENPPPPNFSPFKPSIAVIVGVLTTLFSVTFLLLMYAKHCKQRVESSEPRSSSYYYNNRGFPVAGRKNSGIDPVIIESLPVFRFGSLRGEKNGLECAVCLNRFEPAEILRLLPKCTHAFHLECVDTWLDAHSTCPLCRFRVDPEDVLLVDRVTPVEPDELGLPVSTRRVSGRHSSAGERGRVGNGAAGSNSGTTTQTTSSRRSLDGSISAVDRSRKDGLLLLTVDKDRRVEHKIIIDQGGAHERWSDAQPYDLFYLRSEMLMNEGRRSSSSSKRVQGNHHGMKMQGMTTINGGGRNVTNERSVSEITGLSRFSSRNTGGNEERERERHNGAIARWMAWISQSRPAVRSGS